MNRLRGDDGGWGIAALPVGPASCRSSRWGGGEFLEKKKMDSLQELEKK